MRSWLTYTAARVALFAGAFGVVYLFGARSWIALILAWVISGLASYVLLSKWRDQMSASVVDWSNKREKQDKAVGSRLVGGAAREDEIQDELLRAQEAEAAAGAEKNGEKAEEPAESAERAGTEAPRAEGTKK
ncbi:DUF4229 domain-containing protein [Nocardiopsis metallicus]|uniref:DUF4229 domain-containing protein n=1 Tax=Nocardiopsis metallicus TaxID=179819 RepID=A0A840WGR0_9ACTN|nr:DUF4229 domain-containing protein [Nocardiopsis metallicus]MBB5494643.1 hypothetical protein [Nocardiopsis metallicus]